MSDSIITRVARLLERADRGLFGREVASALGVSKLVARRALCSLGKKNPPIATCNNGIWTWTGAKIKEHNAPACISDQIINQVYAVISRHHGISSAKISEVTGIPRNTLSTITTRLGLRERKVRFSTKFGWCLPDDKECADSHESKNTPNPKNDEPAKIEEEEKMGPIGITDEDLAWMEWYHPDNRANRFAARIRGD